MDRAVNMKVNALSTEQYDFLSRYFELLATVEEGFSFVHDRYKERNYGQGDQLLSDIMGAFVQFNASNMRLRSIFQEDEDVISQLDQFQSIVDQVASLGETFHLEAENKVLFVSEELFPTYQLWKQEIEKTIEMYYKQ
jgi:hypothetical protein